MPNHPVKRDHFGSLMLVGLVAVIGLLLGYQQFSYRSDLATREREEIVVENGFVAQIKETQHQLVANAIWDQAVLHLDNNFDANWTKENIGDYYQHNGGFQFSYVLNAENAPVFGMNGDATVALASFEHLAPQVSPLLDAVRHREHERIQKPIARGEALRDPIQASTPLWVGDTLYIVTATLVQPDFGHVTLKNAHAPVIVTGRAVDRTFLNAFSKRYLASGFHLHRGDSRNEPGEAHASILSATGEPIATLDWFPQTPGATLFKHFLPWIIGFIAGLFALIWALHARTKREAVNVQRAEARARFLAYHDTLTMLPNRTHLEHDISKRLEAAPGQKFALFSLTLTQFKEVNDMHGISVGDELLKAIALRLEAKCGGGARVYRLGGYKFAVLASIHTPEDSDALAQRLLAALMAPFTLSIGDKRIGACAGIAITESGGDCQPPELIRRAHLALFRASTAGSGVHLTFEPRMDEELRQKSLLKDDLRHALEQDALFMVYQPQVRLNREVAGLEALIRWTHPILGPISPAVFIPLAEEAGLINEIGDFALRQAARDSRAWDHLKVAVNVSATQLQDIHFVNRCKAIIAAAGAEISDIEIELTEGVLASNDEHMRATLQALHDEGFSIALDDFGTGYSSLSYLQHFPIDKLKIDRAFVQNLGLDSKADALLAAIVGLAQALDMSVIAEGVETEDQWLRLSRAGCHKIQGFVASKPLRAADVRAFLEKSQDASAAAAGRMSDSAEKPQKPANIFKFRRPDSHLRTGPDPESTEHSGGRGRQRPWQGR